MEALHALAAMGLVAGTWVPLALMFTGVGAFVARPGRPTSRAADDWFRCFWAGWVTALAMLQVWHLALPVDWRALVLLGGIGFAGLAIYGGALIRAAGASVRPYWCFWLIGLVAVAYLANRAIGAPLHFDTGSYHLVAIRWAGACRLPVGLGNLDGPLAINSAYFLYGALLDTGFWAGRAFHLTNGLLLGMAVAQAVAGLPGLLRGQGRPADLFMAICLPGALAWASVDRTGHNVMFVRFVSSPTPDTAVFVLGMVLARQTIALCTRRAARAHRCGARLTCVALLGAGAVMAKVSWAVAAAAFVLAAAVCVMRARATGSRSRAPLAAVLAVVALTGVPWAVRSVALSGYLAYPSPVPSVPVSWRLPQEKVRWEAAYSRRHARWPSAVIANRAQAIEGRRPDQWMRPWFAALPYVGAWSVLAPCVLAVAAGAAMALWRWRRAYERRPPAALAAFFAAVGVSVATWFVSAPNPRFAGSLFWALGAGAWVAATVGLRPPVGVRAGRALALAALAASAYVLVTTQVTRAGPDYGMHPARRVAMETFVTDSGLDVLVPAGAQPGRRTLYWDAPIPCTSEPDRALRLRRPGSMAAGFTKTPPP